MKIKLNSAFTNHLKRKIFFRKMFIVTDLVTLTIPDTCAVLLVLVAKQRKLSFCCPDYRLVSVVSGLCPSVFVTALVDRYFVLFACVNDLRPNQNFSHVRTISCFLWVNHI